MSENQSPAESAPTGRWTARTAVEAVRIRLGDERPAPQPDALGRHLIGYAEGLNPTELWDRARGVWKAKLTTLADCALAVVVHNDLVVGVGTVEAIVPLEDRVAIDGRPLLEHPLIGQRDPLFNTSRNPITYGAITTVLPTSTPARPYDSILRDAVQVLTEAGRLRRSTMRPVGVPVDGNLRDVRWEVDPDRSEPADWAEFVTLALAGATANLGGIETALAGRPGSWEADGVRRLLESTVGPDENDLWRHRTEPLNITLYIEDLVIDRTQMWEGYNAAEREVRRMYEQVDAANPETPLEPYMWTYHREADGETIGPWEPDDPAAPAWTIEAWRATDTDINAESKAFFERLLLGQEMDTMGAPITTTWLPKSPELAAEYDRLEREREDRLAAADLEEDLENQRTREIAAYGQALKERVEAAARAMPGLSVPVNVDVDLTWSSSLDRMSDLPDLVTRLVEQAVMDTPAPDELPGTPLSRLLDAQADRGDDDSPAT
jgi:hypothetical protein